MKYFEGTQGSWTLEKSEGYDYDINSEKGENIAWLGMSDTCESEKEPNAKLIANAPKLLHFLKSFINDFEGDYVMADGKIVDNPNFILRHNYGIAKELYKNVIG